MTNLVTQDEFERLFQGEEIRPHVAHQVDVFLSSRDYEYHADFDDDDEKLEYFYKKLERLNYAKREKTGTVADADNFPLAEMHKKWKQRDSEGNPNPIRSAKFALGTLFYFFREVRNPKYFLAVIGEVWSPKEFDFQRLYFAKLSASPPWGDFQAVSARFFSQSATIREGFREVWSGEPLGPVEQVPLGRFNLLLGVDENVRIRDLKSDPADALYEDGKPNVFAALNWRANISKLYGRDKQLKKLEKWALDGDMHPKIMLISGPGGVGKSRLAAEVVETLKDTHGWVGGDLPKIIREGDVLNGRGNGVVVVIDYPEEDFDLVERLVKSCQNSESYPCPVRIILASRENLDAWKERLNKQNLQNIEEIPFEFKPYLNKRDGLGLAKEVAVNFAKAIREPAPKLQGVEEWRKQKPVHSLPLFLVAAAIHSVLDPKNAFTLSGKELLLELAEIELQRVREYSTNVLKDETALQKLLALSLLTSNGLSKDTIYALGEAGLSDGRSGDALLEAVQKTPYWRAKTEDEPSHLLRLQPDRPAMAFFYIALKVNDPSPALPRWFAPTAIQAGDNFGDILARVAMDLGYVDPIASRTVEDTAIEMLKLAPEIVEKFGNQIYRHSRAFSAAICETLLASATGREEKCGILNNYTRFLSVLGRHEEALIHAETALPIWRQLADERPEAFLPSLATSLSNISQYLYQLGQHRYSLDCAEEAVLIFNQLVNEDGKSFEPKVAKSLSTLANRYSELGRHEEALAHASNAALFYSQLAEKAGSEFLPNLGGICITLASILASLGRREDALARADDAVSIFRKLADAQPEVFLGDLALSLNNVAIELVELGQNDAALSKAEEALSIYRDLASARPDIFLGAKAMSLSTVSSRLADLERFEDALIPSKEAVSIYRELAETNSTMQLQNLANAVHNLSNRYSELQQREDAANCAKEEVIIFFQLAEINPEIYFPDIGMSFAFLAIKQSELGRHDQALVSSEKSVKVFRQMGEIRPQSYLPYLAESLHGMSYELSMLGRLEEAVLRAEEEVSIYRGLITSAHANYMPDLAISLYSLAVLLAKQQQYENAKARAEEAMVSLAPHLLYDLDQVRSEMTEILSFYVGLCHNENLEPKTDLLDLIKSRLG